MFSSLGHTFAHLLASPASLTKQKHCLVSVSLDNGMATLKFIWAEVYPLPLLSH